MTWPMTWIVSSVLAVIFWIAPTSMASAVPLTPSFSVAAIPGISNWVAGESPALGVEDGKLLPCPDKPNCVVSQGADADHGIAPIQYTRDRAAARELLIKVLGVVPRTEIVTQTDDYIRVKCTSRIMGFVDDAEFYFPPDESVIQLRSAARLGESDLGVNRRRLEQIRLALQDLGI